MARSNLNDLLAFLAVAREESLTRAAARLGVSISALSHTIRKPQDLTAHSGYHLYYPSHRQHAPAFKLLVDALRYRIC